MTQKGAANPGFTAPLEGAYSPQFVRSAETLRTLGIAPARSSAGAEGDGAGVAGVEAGSVRHHRRQLH